MVTPARPPDRGRAIAVLVLVGVIALALVAGLGYLIVSAATGHRTPTADASASTTPGVSTAPTESGSQQDRQDALAAAPMLQLPQSAAQPQPLVTATAGPPIVLPAANSKVVPGGPPVAAGFPRTPEGALAQLAAIDEAAMSAADMGKIHEVHDWAAMSGAVPESEWSPAVAVGAVIDSAGGTAGAGGARLSFQSVEGQIKGTVGTDFVVACVLGELDVTLQTIGRAGLGDCQRMVWSQGRWWIGRGRQPAFAPSAWPGSADSVRAGWRVLKHAS